MSNWIWQHKKWPNYLWDEEKLSESYELALRAQGRLEGEGVILGPHETLESHINALIDDAVGTAAIEGEILNPESVRSSLVNQLGLKELGLPHADAKTEGQVRLLLEANYQFNAPLTHERLFSWHGFLFPFGAPFERFPVKAYRDDSVVVASGLPSKQIVHYEAPPADRVKVEMAQFIRWFEGEGLQLPELFYAAIAHFWFVTIHPFGDGNGRISRAVGDLAHCKKSQKGQRLFSVPASILQDRPGYYAVLKKTQAGNLDITEWLDWYFKRIIQAVEVAEVRVKQVIQRIRFWECVAGIHFNERQRKALRKMLAVAGRKNEAEKMPEIGLTEYAGGMTTRKYVSINRCATQTAAKDLTDLYDKGVFVRSEAGGRSTHYQINWQILG